jgi:flagellar biogenesis protein FliO
MALPATMRDWTADPFRWLRAKFAERRIRRLKLVETLPLGAGRFVSLISVEGEKFLVGGAANSVSLLTRLGSAGAAPRQDLP